MALPRPKGVDRAPLQRSRRGMVTPTTDAKTPQRTPPSRERQFTLCGPSARLPIVRRSAQDRVEEGIGHRDPKFCWKCIMQQINLSKLEDMIAVAICSEASSDNLVVSSLPDPYVPSTLCVEEGELSVEVIFVKAPAAVGKSITAQYLSARRNAPLLNLAEVAVGTGSLQGLVSEYSEGGREAFHRGDLPVIIDALDEGRILSGERAFEAFLESTVAFLHSNRTLTNRPKLILLGREESSELSKIAVKIEDINITTCTLILDFFQKDSAIQLIDVYTRKELARLAQVGEIREQDKQRREGLLTRDTMYQLKNAFFSAIERAVEVQAGHLWDDEKGRTFAGYAPVLASIGTLLASVENPQPLTNSLLATASYQNPIERDMPIANEKIVTASYRAWNVIDTVIQEILLREKYKLQSKLTEMQTVPTDAYDPPEQLAYLIQLLSGSRQISLEKHLQFNSDRDRNIYLEKISQICEEHPFIRSRRMANDVLGSIILAHALCHRTDVEEGSYRSLVSDLAKGPFLWRSIRRELTTKEIILNGQFFGYIITSYWNDPLERMISSRRLKITEQSDGVLSVTMGSDDQTTIRFLLMPPVLMYGSIRSADVDIPNSKMIIEGATLEGTGSSSLFYFQRENYIRCNEIEYRTKSTDFSGSLWLEASVVTMTTTEPEARIEPDFRYGWGGNIRCHEPWKDLTSESLESPYFQSPIMKFFSDLQINTPRTGFILLDDYSIPENDKQMTWTKQYHGVFSPFVKFMVEEGFAVRRKVPSRRPDNKFLIMVNKMPWAEIMQVCRGGSCANQSAKRLVDTVTNLIKS